MDRETVLSIMHSREFSLNAESRAGDKAISYYFLSKPVYHRRHKDRVIIPAFCCTVYPDSDEFQLTYAVPKSINKLETPKCGSFKNEDHFFRILAKFETAVQVLYREFGDE